MTSKNSFLASLLENMKRRIFVIILAALYFCFFFPVGLTVKLNSALAEQEKYPSELFNIKEVALAYLDNEVMIIGVIILAIICAIQGFSYLYSKKKVDFYHSTPISRTKRFSTIYLNGIAIFVIPYIISAILSIFILNIFHAFSWMIVLTILRSFCINLFMFLAIYLVALVAVMMTGHIVVTVLATGVFLGYESCIR